MNPAGMNSQGSGGGGLVHSRRGVQPAALFSLALCTIWTLAGRHPQATLRQAAFVLPAGAWTGRRR